MQALRVALFLPASIAFSLTAQSQNVSPGDVLVVSETVNSPSGSTLRVFDGCSGVLKFGFTDSSWASSGAGRFVEVSPDGTIWVSDPTTERLFRYDNQMQLLCVTPAAGTQHIRGFAFESASSLWAVGGAANGAFVHYLGQTCAAPGQASVLGFDPVDCSWHISDQLCITSNVGAPGVRLVDTTSGLTTQTLDCGGSVGDGLMSCDTTASGLIVVTENDQRRIVALDPSQVGASQCAWSIPTGADEYPWLAGVDVDEHRNRVYTMVRRAGTWWLEAFDSSSLARVLSVDIGDFSVHNLAIVPGGDCAPKRYCTAGISTNLCQPTMSATGVPSLSASAGFVLTANLVEGQRSGLLFYGVSGRNSSTWGCTSTSLLCVKAPTQRMSAMNSGGSLGQCDGAISVDWLSYLAASPVALGQPFTPGDIVNAQGWYRDPPSCKSTNLSDALEWTVFP